MMNTPGDRSGGFGDRPDTGSPASSLGSSGRSYSVEPSSNNQVGSSDEGDNNQPMSQTAYNKAQGITATNPYGNQGFFSRVFGIDPSKISYTNLLSQDQINKIAANQYSKYRNPFNDPSQPAYNPNFASGDMASGILRSGVRTGQKVIDPRTGQETTVESFRAPMGLADTAASLALGANIPIVGSALADVGTRVKGLEGQPPTIDGQQATERGSSLLSGILGPAVEQLTTGSGSGRLLDQVMQTASNLFNRPQETKVERAPASDKNKADELIRDTIRNTAQDRFTSGQPFDLDQPTPSRFQSRPEVNLQRGPKTIQDPTSAVPSQIEINQRPLQRDQGIMDALMGGARDGVNPPSVAGLANIPTQQVADASTSEFLSRGAANTINDILETFQKGPRPVDLGPGQLKFSIDPFGEEKSIGGTYTMPVQDLGLGSLLSQNQAQQPASDAFQIADTSMLGNFMKQGNLKSQGGGFFGSDKGGARYYQFGTKGSSRPSRSSSGDGNVFDKMLQMFKFDPNRGAGKFG